MKNFIRTVLGDVDAESFGACYAHEHIIIDRSYATEHFPHLLLESVEDAVVELKDLYRAGGRALVDAMPYVLEGLCDTALFRAAMLFLTLLLCLRFAAQPGGAEAKAAAGAKPPKWCPTPTGSCSASKKEASKASATTKASAAPATASCWNSTYRK